VPENPRQDRLVRVPPQSYFLVNSVFHYLGPSLAVLLFARLDVLGVAWLRVASAAAVFALWRRPWRRCRPLGRDSLRTLLALGAVLAVMNTAFYLAVDRLPLSTVGAIEFLGTVLLAAAGARTPRNAAALLLTMAGVAALTAVRITGQPLGFVFAFANCALFMLYIVLGHRIANEGGPGGIDRLGAAMLVAAVIATPWGLGGALPAFGHPLLLLAGAGVGVCSSVIPYVTDQLAMARLPRATFSLMLALLPVFATVIGAVVLRQLPTVQDVAGITLVVLGVAIHREQRKELSVDYIRLGSTGLKVSRICLGMMSYGSQAERAWHLDEAAAEPIVKAAVDGGVTFFDTADTYSDGVSEQITGRLLSRLFDSRDDYVLATKVFFPMGRGPNDRGLSRKHVLAGIDASLRRLGADYVDLYQIHRWDYETPIEETMEALHDVVKAGKARYIGASSMFAWQFAKAQHVAERNGWTRFVSMQNHYNLLYREEEREMLPLCADQGIAVLPYSPLARGMLTGNRNRQGERRTARAGDDPLSDERYNTDADFDVVDRLGQVAAERGAPPAQVALAWLLSRPGVTAPIVGATKLGHISDALAASQLTLTAKEAARLEELYVPHPVLAHR
jgi:aryl-alcohol dehydrogenase-like predicted oxidoreductase/threonine/homoserine efflux transporter RhtA